MKLRTLSIDDEPDALDKLNHYIGKIPFFELVASCHGSTEALEYMSDHDVDVIFTDIDMPDINGIDFVESLTMRTMVVFITAHRQYAVDGFRLSAIDYLVKPYSMQDFQRAANKVMEVYRSRNLSQTDPGKLSDSLFVKVETRYERISQSSIRYIKGYGEYLQIFVEGKMQPVMTISSFASVMDRLAPCFLQIHRSYIVNMNHIMKVEKSRIVMDSDTYLPISDTYRDSFMDFLRSHSVGKAPK